MITIKNALILNMALFVLSTNIFAAQKESVGEFSLAVQSNQISLQYPNSVNRTKISTIRATWWQPFSKWLEGALSLAYVDMSQNSYSTVPAYSTTGYDMGVGLRGKIIQNDIFNFGLGLTIDYLSTTGGTAANNRTEITWTEYVGSADFVFIPKKPVSILAGVSYTVIDGEQKIYNNFNRILSFSADVPEGYYAGIGFKTGGNGRINMTWHEGTRQGFYLTFGTSF